MASTMRWSKQAIHVGTCISNGLYFCLVHTFDGWRLVFKRYLKGCCILFQIARSEYDSKLLFSAHEINDPFNMALLLHS